MIKHGLLSTVILAGFTLTAAPVSADTGFYIGAGAGGASIEADFDGSDLPGVPSSIDEDDTAIKVFGGFTFDLPVVDLAVEAAYNDFGQPDIDVLGETLTFDTTGLSVWGIASLGLGPIDVFGKVGLIQWDVEAEFAGFSADDDGTDPGFGIGAAFGLGSIEVRGEIEVYELDDTDLSMLSLGVLYRF